ncbi:hypothetical protein WN51_12136 [Melipona quadrifasciata]|uniref:Uncharacterized protein n=1 Tax=Melipona quadrifasciata TaxID=166423 RepID=A0A0M9A3F6_9HYME|nr:hypothetical protein WN51_12136 [Melipona quadrifasciata]
MAGSVRTQSVGGFIERRSNKEKDPKLISGGGKGIPKVKCFTEVSCAGTYHYALLPKQSTLLFNIPNCQMLD